MSKLNEKVALITGGNSGIGLATARRFVEEGAKVVITGRNQASLTAAVNELGQENAFAVQADATEPAGAEQAVAAAIKQFGKLDIVFANAGVAGSTPLGDTKLEDFEHILKINVTGVFFTVQAAAPYLQPGASVILVGSVLATTGGFGWAAYAASKGAVSSMAKVLASELSPRGIRVNTVVPGATKTPIWGASSPEQLMQLEAALSHSIPQNRLGEPEEIANAVLFLASDESSFVQAAELQVDGGADGAPFGAPIYRQ
ncbi:glucose 1-dehydrogenase [Paenibacillus lupini]|uniref:SDR family NAD(P)-dependent oxidoreductase n=1 Tax=Paenibacillus lupini TaxID=1450204 RepID=UPI001422FA21|nr:glucose 1-dehydrogenase [Paenibacillus lupini]NIK23172.1 NAD(P)-dependent dehydrogenase (short-subunit alcohol dehydrogenase family) [Paenibacillus lupini]